MRIIKRLIKKKALVLWYTINSNLGDYYIFKTVKRYLEEWGYICIDMDVGLPYKQISKVAKKCDFLWFAGGGIIERGIPNIILQFENFHKDAKDIKYGVTGLSIGEFDYSDKKDSLKYWLENALFFYTRDKYSSNELNRLTDSKKAFSSVDVVFANGIEKQYINVKASYDVGINFRDVPYPDLTGDLNWDEWSKSINGLNKKIIGIPDQYNVSDLVHYNMASDYSPQKTIEVISKCDIIVAMRFHVVLFAAKLGKIPIPINYCPKVERLSEQLGIRELVLGIHDYKKLQEKISDVYEKKEQYLDIITKNVNSLENDIMILFDIIKELMEKELYL